MTTESNPTGDPTAGASPSPAPDPATSAVLAPSLPEGFGLATATFVVISSMVGTGVLTTSGFTVASVGSNSLMLLLWVLGGLVALCGALTVAELAASMPASGGEYVYLYQAYGPLAAFLSGWVSFLIGFAAPIAASAFASASYLVAPLDLTQPTRGLVCKGLATVSILVLAAIHTAGRTHTVRAQAGITLLKLGVLVGLVVAGLAVGLGGGHGSNLVDLPRVDGRLAVLMLFSMVYISYGYTGWNAAAYLADEVRDPGRLLPRSILLGTAGVMVLYLGLNTVYALALPASEIARIVEKDGFDAVAPIAELAARRLFGPAIAAPLSVAVGLTLLASVSAYILTGPRVAYAMARAGQFPAIAGRLTERSQTPGIATALQVTWALVLLWTGHFESIVIYAGVGLALFSMLSVASIFFLRRKQPDLPRPFRTPGYPFVPAAFLVVTTALTIAAFLERPWVSLYALLSILAGVPIYYFGIGRRRT
jgi:APA family basic amino acid/polyamine antiporter